MYNISETVLPIYINGQCPIIKTCSDATLNLSSKDCTPLQLGHSDLEYVMVGVFINSQLIINNCLSKGFPNQFNEAFKKMYRYDVYILLLARIAQSVELVTNS